MRGGLQRPEEIRPTGHCARQFGGLGLGIGKQLPATPSCDPRTNHQGPGLGGGGGGRQCSPVPWFLKTQPKQWHFYRKEFKQVFCTI